jgi:hypothetical protein
MGLCVTLTETGTLTPTGQALADCTGYVLATPAEAVALTTLAQLFEMPPAVETSALFTFIVVSVIGAFLTGRAFAVPANLAR